MCSVKKGALKSFSKSTGKRLCQGPFLNKGTLAQLFSCEFCENFKNMLFTGHSKQTSNSFKIHTFSKFSSTLSFFYDFFFSKRGRGIFKKILSMFFDAHAF